MFEQYTEKARRVIFFARYEASQWGADHIDTSHLLLALLREDKSLFEKLMGSSSPFENPAEALGLKRAGEKVSTSVDMPLTSELRRVLALAADEAKHLRQGPITPGHLLLGIMQQPSAACDLLKKSGLELDGVRKALLEITPATAKLKIPPLEAPDPSTNNVQIMDQLRDKFHALTVGLKPEMEPAVVYRLDK
jgi:ATP-dependent Clp protease ATP-binding subunit ClpC